MSASVHTRRRIDEYVNSIYLDSLLKKKVANFGRKLRVHELLIVSRAIHLELPKDIKEHFSHMELASYFLEHA